MLSISELTFVFRAAKIHFLIKKGNNYLIQNTMSWIISLTLLISDYDA